MSLDAWMQVLFVLQMCTNVGHEQVCMDASCVLYKIRIEMILLWSAVYNVMWFQFFCQPIRIFYFASTAANASCNVVHLWELCIERS